MVNKLRLTVCLAAALCSRYLHAQSMQLGIDEMFRMAEEQSQGIRTFRTGEEAAEAALDAARALRLPDVRVSASVSYLGNGFISDRDFGHGRSVYIPHFGQNFALEAEQVVYAGGAVSSRIRQAELGRQMAELSRRRQTQEIRFLLTGHYLNLFKTDNQIKVLERNLALTEQLIAHIRARREQGTALKNDVTRYELQREQIRLRLAQATDNRLIFNHQLVTTLHLPAETVILPDTTLIDRPVAALTEADWQQTATLNNLDLQQADTDVVLSGQRVRQERAERLPHVALVAADRLDGPITIEVPAINKNFNYWYVGVGVRYNISSLFKNDKRLKQARLNQRRSAEQRDLAREQVENGVQAGYTHLLTAFTDLRTQENSVRLADENYRVTCNRYRQEMALLTDMIDASNAKLAAELDWVNARVNVVYHYYRMKYITHTL